MTAIQLGDDAKVDSVSRRACSLPYDEREGTNHGRWGAHMLLFNALSDAAEESDDTDSTWLDAC